MEKLSNANAFREHLKFEDTSDVYIMMALPRKKDGFPVSKSPDGKFAKRRIIANLDEYDQCFEELTTEFPNERVYITFNRRSVRKAYLELNRVANENLLLGGVENADRYLIKLSSEFKSILMKPKSKAKTDFFLYDIDSTNFAAYQGLIHDLEEYTEVTLILPTRNGYHVLARPYNMNLVDHRKYGQVELKTDALTNLTS